MHHSYLLPTLNCSPAFSALVCLLGFYAFSVECVIILFMTSVKNAPRVGNIAEKMTGRINNGLFSEFLSFECVDLHNALFYFTQTLIAVHASWSLNITENLALSPKFTK